jgi:hypothetical protein
MIKVVVYPEKVICPSFLAIEIKCLDYLHIQQITKEKNTHYNIDKERRHQKNVNKSSSFTKFLSSSGTPDTLVDKRSFVLVGDKENLIVSPKLITCNGIFKCIIKKEKTKIMYRIMIT